MTNEELDVARAKKAAEIWDPSNGTLATTAARLAREGWMPPEPVDPDLIEAQQIFRNSSLTTPIGMTLTGIKRGRELERREAKPGMVWVKHDGSGNWPVDLKARVLVIYGGGNPHFKVADSVVWECVTHYAVITLPAEDVA